MSKHLVLDGKTLKITYWSEEKFCPLEEWFYSKDLQESDRKKIIQKIGFIANNGYPRNKEIFRKLWEDYFEIKPSGQIRFPGLIEAHEFVILNLRKKVIITQNITKNV